jgi:hypothetical protein
MSVSVVALGENDAMRHKINALFILKTWGAKSAASSRDLAERSPNWAATGVTLEQLIVLSYEMGWVVCLEAWSIKNADHSLSIGMSCRILRLVNGGNHAPARFNRLKKNAYRPSEYAATGSACSAST